MNANDEYFMQLALQQAELAFAVGEVPVGAVLVKDGEVIAAGYNRPISHCDPSAHAEIVVLRQAAQVLDNYRLVGTQLYVTLEPCLMCVGALVHGRINRLVFGAYESKAGAVVSKARLLDAEYLNHRVSYQGGVLEVASSTLLAKFFRQRRQDNHLI